MDAKRKTTALLAAAALFAGGRTPYLPAGGILSTRFALAAAMSSLPQTKDELQNLIQARAAELEKVNQQLQETQGNLNNTKQQGLTLQKKLAALQSNINQLELNIKSDSLTSQKLAFEIDSIRYDIRDIELSMDGKKQAVVSLLQEIQKQDQTTPLILFLKNQTLAESFLEAQSLANLRIQLSADIVSLADFHKELDAKANEVSVRKLNIELHQKNLAARESIIQDQKEEQKVILAQTKDKESLYQQQLDVLKAQQNVISDEISQMEDRLRANFDASILPTPRPGLFSWPIQPAAGASTPIVTQHFGEKSYLYRGKPHNGVDIGAPLGTPVFAADDGVVMAVDNNDRSRWAKYQYGKYVLIKHLNDLATIYGHLSRQVVSAGESVKRGQLIGYSGSTGYATGPHLHFGAYWAPSILLKSIPPAAGFVPVGVLVNPENYLNE